MIQYNLESGERDLFDGDIGFRVWDLEIGFGLGFRIPVGRILLLFLRQSYGDWYDFKVSFSWIYPLAHKGDEKLMSEIAGLRHSVRP